MIIKKINELIICDKLINGKWLLKTLRMVFLLNIYHRNNDSVLVKNIIFIKILVKLYNYWIKYYFYI